MADCGEPYIDCAKQHESPESLFKRLISVDDDGNLALNICGCDCGGGGVTLVTYSELVALIGSSGLTAGAFYLLTDFTTVHYFTCVHGGVNTTLADINTGNVEPLLLLATSVNTLADRVYSLLYPNDKIHYDWNPADFLNDFSFSADGVNIVDGFKGVITFRHDLIQDNYTYYDFRAVLFRRWLASQEDEWWDGKYVCWFDDSLYINSQVTINAGLNYENFYTFHSDIGGDYSNFTGNHIESTRPHPNQFVNIFRTRLNNIVLFSFNDKKYFSPVVENTFGIGCRYMTVLGFSQSNVFESACYNMIFENTTTRNKFGLGSNLSIFAASVTENTFYVGQSSIGGVFIENKMDNLVNCDIGDSFQINTGVLKSCIVANNAKNNTFIQLESLDMTLATHIYQNYDTIFGRSPDGSYYVMYVDNAHVLQTAAANT